MTTIVLLLVGFACLASLAVLAQAFRGAVAAWGELQHALATCPARRAGRVTVIEFKAIPAGRAPLRRIRPPFRPQSDLRAAA